MMDYLASMYIDNELNLGEKVQFIEKIRSEEEFFQETVALLHQEKLLRTQPEKLKVLAPAETRIRPDLKNWIGKLLRPMIYAGGGFALATLILFNLTTDATDELTTAGRFVIFEPAVSRVELTGTFNGWQRMEMKQIGNSGYWELNLQLPAGEHRFAYILDGSHRMADPTHPAREKDDFGGENSVVTIPLGAETISSDRNRSST